MEEAEIGYSIRLTKLLDGVSTYTLNHDGLDGYLEFESYGDASDYIHEFIRRHKASAAIAAMNAGK